MIELGRARETDIVLAFLKAETDRWHNNSSVQTFLSSVGVTNERLIHADFQGDYANKLRACVLDAFRGYLRKDGIFRRFPNGAVWRRVELEPTDLSRLRYVKSIEWLEISDGTRLPQRAVEMLDGGQRTDGAHLANAALKVAGIKKSLESGERLFELVAVEGQGDDLILVEGAHRTTTYVALRWTKNLPALIGRSPFMPNWAFY